MEEPTFATAKERDAYHSKNKAADYWRQYDAIMKPKPVKPSNLVGEPLQLNYKNGYSKGPGKALADVKTAYKGYVSKKPRN